MRNRCHRCHGLFLYPYKPKVFLPSRDGLTNVVISADTCQNKRSHVELPADGFNWKFAGWIFVTTQHLLLACVGWSTCNN